MTSEATIRGARSDDIRALQDIERAAGVLFGGIGMEDIAADPPLEEEVLAGYIGDGRAWVAEVEGQVVGYALADEVDGQGHLEQVSVDPAFGRRGLGRRLIETVCSWARDRGFSRLTLITFRDVPWNGPYYASLGFVVVLDDDLGPGLRELRTREAEHGLDVTARQVMAVAIDKVVDRL